MGRSTLSSELQLDPGSSRRKSKLGFRSMLKALFAVACLWAVYFVTTVVRSNIDTRQAPHEGLYQNLDTPYKQNEVVRPLVAINQTFSIVATVWIRDSTVETASSDSNPSREFMEGGPILRDKAIFSDTIFRDLHLGDNLKDIKSVVDLKIPTAVFHDLELWNYDLRASFVLVPDSPSPLDHAVNFSSWIPSGVNYPSIRPWQEGPLPSLQDQIVDSYGVFMPLLSFMPINSTCVKTKGFIGAPEKVDPTQRAQDSPDDETDDMDIPVLKSDPAHGTHFWKYESTKSRSAIDAHPYIVTRSHLRFLNMVRLYNRTAYEQHHRELRSRSCGNGFIDNRLDWRMCWKDFSSNANSETRIKLRTKDSSSQKMITDWAYGPYLSLSESAWGPLDLVKVPVDRERCQEPLASTLDDNKFSNNEEPYIEVKWNILFSVHTPGQLFLADTMGFAVSVYNMKSNLETETGKQKAQLRVEFANGLIGHKLNEDAHPRRHSALYVMYGIISLLASIPTFHYWFTRASTVGISIQGNALIASASLLNLALNAIFKNSGKSGPGTIFSWLSVLFWQLPFGLTALFTLKSILRVEVHWRKSWVPIIRISPSTHLERASQRNEARILWTYKALAFAALAGIFSYTYNLSILSPSPRFASFDNLDTPLVKSQSLLVFPAIIVGRALQLLLNAHSKSFAGTYRPCAPLYLLRSLIGIAMALPHVVGSVASAQGISIFSAMVLVSDFILTYQAITYSPVSSPEEEDDSMR